MKFHPDVLAAHAQFGGDLESMQKCYDWCDLTKEVSRLKIEASKHAHDAETVRRQRDQFMRENQSFTDAVVTLWEALSKACEIMSAYKRAGHGDEVHMDTLCCAIRTAEDALLQTAVQKQRCPAPNPQMTVVWTSQYQLDEALNCGMGYIYAEEGKPEKADIPLMRLADGGPASSNNLPLFGELPSPSPFTRRSGYSAADLVAKIAQVATAVGFQANEPAMEMAGQIVSILAANPEHIDRFMDEGSELFLDGTFNHENGSLTYRAINGAILSPSVLREKKGQQQ